MANAWLRLWHDMPNDPKWRTIARVSGQPIATVMAVYIHLLVSASRNVTTCHGVSLRGHIDVTTEDLASALDVTEEVIDSILQAMQGRVLDGDLITGWEKRQVLKEDNGNISQTAKSPAERKRAQRERERKREQNGDCHGASRNVTHMSRRVTTDKDTDKDTDQEDQNTMVHGVKNATNQAGDVQTVNLGQPAGTTPEADSAYALKADSGAVQQDDRKAGAITPTAAARSRFRHSAGSRSGSPGKHRAVCGTSGLSGCVRTGLAGVPVACWGKPEEIRFQCLEGQITRGGATRGHAGWREALRKILGGYRENGNGICSASDDVFWTGPEF